MLKKLLRRWLDIPEAVKAAPVKKSGFFNTTDAGPPVIAAKSWNDLVDGIGAMVIQAKAPKQFARESIAQDGAVTIAMDDICDGAGTITKTYGLGGWNGIPYAQMEWYGRQSFIGYQLCAMLLQNWFINKACTMPARDATRNGFETKRGDGEVLDPKMAKEIAKLDKKFQLKANLIEAVRMMRCFGIRIVLFQVNSADPDYYLKPFNPDGITPGSYKGMSQVDPYWITPELNFDASANPASQHFYEPTYWRINGQRYHRSHLVVLTGPEVPDVLKPTYAYGGIPLPQMVYERVYAATRTTDEAPVLAMTKRMTSVTGVDMTAAMANPKIFNDRILAFTQLRDNHGIYMLGAEENISQTDTTLTDFDALIMTQWQLACSIVEIPGTKMMGTQPKGFNASGDYEEASYREMLESVQELDMTPIIERHHVCIMRSNLMPKFKLPAPFELTIDWAEVDPETGAEKSARELQDSTRDKNLTDTGAIDGTDIRDRMRKDPTSSYHGIEEGVPETDPTVVTHPDGTQVTQPPAPGQKAAPPGSGPVPPKPVNPFAKPGGSPPPAAKPGVVPPAKHANPFAKAG
jgi:phage-related protein (TIGR01555 family)